MPELTRRTLLAAMVAAPAYAQPPDPLQQLLAEEHAAVHLYGVLGPRLPKDVRPAALTAYDDHRRHRDALEQAIRAAGGTPEPSLPAYAVPPGIALDAAATIEDALLRRWHASLATGGATAAACYVDEATHLALLRWRRTRDPARATSAFPGRP